MGLAILSRNWGIDITSDMFFVETSYELPTFSSVVKIGSDAQKQERECYIETAWRFDSENPQDYCIPRFWCVPVEDQHGRRSHVSQKMGHS